MTNPLRLTRLARLGALTLLAALGVAIAALGSMSAPARAQQLARPANERPAQLPPQHLGHWTHHVEISVPFRDANGDGTNDYDPQFTVGVARHISSTAAGEGACPHETHPQPRIARSGSGAERVAKSSHSGYDALCVLSVTFQDSVASGVNQITLRRTSARNVQTAPGSRYSTARATYTDGRTTFHPELTLSGFDGDQAGQRLNVNFTPTVFAPAACRVHRSHDHDIWEITADGTAVRRARATLIGALPAREGNCTYDVVWPSVATFDTPATTRVTADQPSASGTYVVPVVPDGSQWTHTVEVAVPFRDANGDGENDYDPQFSVTSSRVSSDPAQGSGICPGAHPLAPRINHDEMSTELLATVSEVLVAAGCVLRTQFEGEVASGIAGITLTRQSAEFAQSSRDDPVARAAYTDGRTTFEPNLAFVGFDVEQAGETLEVVFNVASGAPHACELHPHDDHETWVVDSTGAVTRQSSAAALIDELPNSQGDCDYFVEWPSATGLVAPAHEPVSGDAPDATATYEIAAVVREVVLDLDTVRDAEGETFTVRVAPTTGAHPNCDADREVVLTVGSDGIALETILVTDLPQGRTGDVDRCAYVVTWPDSEDGGGTYRHVGSLTARIDGALFDRARERNKQPIIGRAYLRAPDSFGTSLRVHLAKPPAADTTFVVRVVRADPELGGCSPDDDYAVTIAAGSGEPGVISLALIHSPLDTTSSCIYNVEWPQTDVDDGGWAQDPSFASMRETELNTGAGSASNRYFPTFDGNIDVRTTSAAAQAAQFEVTIAPVAGSHQRCSTQRTVTAPVRVGRTAGLVTVPDLVERPGGADADCEYEVRWPDNEVDGDLWVDDDSYPTGRTLSAARPTATHRYRVSRDTTFAPDVRVAVPQIEGLVAGENLFAGTEFTLTFSRAPNSDDGCSAVTPITVTFTVGTDGQVTGDHPTPLIDQPERATEPCVYVFHADPNPVRSAPHAPLSWQLNVNTVTALLRATSPRAALTYHVGDITFTPQVTIAVPQIDEAIGGGQANMFSDVTFTDGSVGPLTFEVGFTAASRSAAGCTDTQSTTYTYTVGASGAVTGTPPSLVAQAVRTASDGTQTQVGEPCVYELTLPVRAPPISGPASGPALLSKEGAVGLPDGQTSGAAPAVSIGYRNVSIASAVELLLATPTFTEPPTRAVTVTISAAAGTNAACFVDNLDPLDPVPAASKSRAVPLDVGGSNSLAGYFRVIDLPAGATSTDDRCTYDVAWPLHDAGVSDPAAEPMFTRTQRDVRWLPSGRVGSSSSLTATYEVPSAVSFHATLELVVVPHVPAGTEFTVGVAPSSDSPMGCTAANTYVLTAPAIDGTNDRTLDVEIELAHTVAGVVHHCEYEVTWPDDEDGAGVLFVPEAGFTPDVTLSEGSPTARNRYADADEAIPFDATLTVTTTEDVTVDTTFVVDVAAPASPAGCTATDDYEVVVVAGTSTTTRTISLIRRPATAHDDCAYVLTWEPHESGGTNWAQDDTHTPDATLSFASGSAANRYAPNVGTFAPSLTFDLPDIDFDGDGSHDYAGATFSVDFVRSDDESCSANRTEMYALDAAGDVTPVTPFELIDAHAASACAYTVVFPLASGSTLAGRLTLIAGGATDDDVSGGANDAQASYAEAVTRFDANLYLGGTHIVNDDGSQSEVIPVGTPFSVTVRPQASAPPGCDADPASTATSVTVVMEKSDPVQTQPFTLLTISTLVGLIDRTAAGEVCVYDVVWPTNEVNGALYVRDVTSQFRNTLRAGDAEDVGAIAWYRAATVAATSFDAGLEVRLAAAADVDQHFPVSVSPPAEPADCSSRREVTVTVAAGATSGTEPVSHLVLRPSGATSDCVYAVGWPDGDSDDNGYEQDDSYADSRSDALAESGPSASNRYAVPAPAITPPTTPPTTPGSTRPPVSGGGSGGGSRSGGTSRAGSGGGSSGGGSSGGAVGTWQVTGTPVPLSVTLAMPDVAFDVGAAVEVMVNVPGTCGDDLSLFSGLPASVGLVYALGAQPGTMADVLAGAALRLAAFAERGDETRGCELRVTLLSAPPGCALVGTSADAVARTDDAGRRYIEVTGRDAATSFTLAPALSCA